MAAALLAVRLADRAPDVATVSAGLLPGGAPAPAEVVEVMAARGIDLSGHRSTALTGAAVRAADLVVGMGRRHVQEAVLLDPDGLPRTFRMRELVRRGRALGPRPPGRPTADWIDEVGRGRTRDDLVRHGPDEDVADPFGGPPEGYRATADELDLLAGTLADLLWPRR